MVSIPCRQQNGLGRVPAADWPEGVPGDDFHGLTYNQYEYVSHEQIRHKNILPGRASYIFIT
jgi:hypothetical protein